MVRFHNSIYPARIALSVARNVYDDTKLLSDPDSPIIPERAGDTPINTSISKVNAQSVNKPTSTPSPSSISDALEVPISVLGTSVSSYKYIAVCCVYNRVMQNFKLKDDLNGACITILHPLYMFLTKNEGRK